MSKTVLKITKDFKATFEKPYKLKDWDVWVDNEKVFCRLHNRPGYGEIWSFILEKPEGILEFYHNKDRHWCSLIIS